MLHAQNFLSFPLLNDVQEEQHRQKVVHHRSQCLISSRRSSRRGGSKDVVKSPEDGSCIYLFICSTSLKVHQQHLRCQSSKNRNNDQLGLDWLSRPSLRLCCVLKTKAVPQETGAPFRHLSLLHRRFDSKTSDVDSFFLRLIYRISSPRTTSLTIKRNLKTFVNLLNDEQPLASKMSSTPPWKEAASLIIVARASMSQKMGQSLTKSMVVASRVVHDEKQKAIASQSSAIAKTDYRIMMVKRSGLSSFMASAYVFPGGAVEIADYSSRWWSVFEKSGASREHLAQLTSRHATGPRPPMTTDPETVKLAVAGGHPREDFLPADIGLRITAIRETFEETGVLLLTNPRQDAVGSVGNNPLSDLDDSGLDLSAWREKVRKSGAAFIDLCVETGLCPDVWSLYEWSNWLTPISVGHKRFDTMFYVCCLEKLPKVVLDQTEVTTLKWCTCLEMLEEHTQERLFLAPPQVYELSRIHHLSNFSALEDFVKKRDRLGCVRWLPVLATYRDGAISFLPGDSMYPAEPDIIGRKPVPDYPQTVPEMRAKAVDLNRIELRGPTCVSFCNIKLPLGHLSPVTHPPQDLGATSTTSQSML